MDKFRNIFDKSTSGSMGFRFAPDIQIFYDFDNDSIIESFTNGTFHEYKKLLVLQDFHNSILCHLRYKDYHLLYYHSKLLKDPEQSFMENHIWNRIYYDNLKNKNNGWNTFSHYLLILDIYSLIHISKMKDRTLQMLLNNALL